MQYIEEEVRDLFFFGFPFAIIIPLVIFFFIFRTGGRVFRSFERRRQSSFDYDPYRSLPDVYRSDRGGQTNLVSQLFKLAYRRKGRLTVSDIVIETGLGVEEAEQLIQGMVDNVRVRMEVNERGMVVYEFPEIQDRFEDES